MKHKWLQFLQDERGKFSAIQITFLLTTGTVTAVWAFLSIITGVIQDVPLGVQGLVGILAGGKFGHLWLKTRHRKKSKGRKKRKSFWRKLWERILTVLCFIKDLRGK